MKKLLLILLLCGICYAQGSAIPPYVDPYWRDIIGQSSSETYAVDFSGGTWSSGVMNWDATPSVYANGTRLIKSDTANGNLFFGDSAFAGQDEGDLNVGVGYQAGLNNNVGGDGATGLEGERNIYIGYQAGAGLTAATNNTGYQNMFIGAYAGYKNTTGYDNAFLGYGAGQANTTGIDNTFVGRTAGYSNADGLQNIYIGRGAGFTGISCDYNTFIGANAGYDNTASNNTFIGSNAGYENTSAQRGVFIGVQAGDLNTEGHSNTAIGYRAMFYNQTGDDNSIIGQYAGGFGAGGANSFNNAVIIGSEAAYDLKTGSNNTIIGFQSGTDLTTGSDNLFLGHKSGFNQTTNSYLLIIDNQDRGSAANELTNSMLYGVFNATVASQSLRVNAGTVTLNGGADSDLTINLTGTTNSGVVKWMEDEDYVEFDDDIVFSGDAVGFPYGCLYGNEIAWGNGGAAQNVWTTISDADITAGEVHRTTYQNNQELLVSVAGRYLVNWALTIESSVANKHLQAATEINGTETAAGRIHIQAGTANVDYCMSGTAILDLAANDLVSIGVMCDDAVTPTIGVSHYNLTLTHVGGT